MNISQVHFLIFCLSSSLFLIMADESEKPLISQDEEDIDQQGGLGSLLVRGSPMGNPRSRTEWPEVVGLTAADAEKKIREYNPNALIQVVPPNCFVTMDFITGRVRLHTDSQGIVARPATFG